VELPVKRRREENWQFEKAFTEQMGGGRVWAGFFVIGCGAMSRERLKVSMDYEPNGKPFLQSRGLDQFPFPVEQ
jgi:hypothetical protein